MQTDEHIQNQQRAFLNDLIKMELQVLTATFPKDATFKELVKENIKINRKSFRELKSIHMRLKSLILNKINVLQINTETYVNEYHNIIELGNKGEDYKIKLGEFEEKLKTILRNQPQRKVQSKKSNLYREAKTRPLKKYELRTNDSTIKVLNTLQKKTPITKMSSTAATTSTVKLDSSSRLKITTPPPKPPNNKGKPKEKLRNTMIAQVLLESLKEKDLYFNYLYLLLNQLTSWVWHWGNKTCLPSQFNSNALAQIKACLLKIRDEIQKYDMYSDANMLPILSRFFALKEHPLPTELSTEREIIDTAFKIIAATKANQGLPRDYEDPITHQLFAIPYPSSKESRLPTAHAAYSCGEVIATAGGGGR